MTHDPIVEQRLSSLATDDRRDHDWEELKLPDTAGTLQWSGSSTSAITFMSQLNILCSVYLHSVVNIQTVCRRVVR